MWLMWSHRVAEGAKSWLPSNSIPWPHTALEYNPGEKLLSDCEMLLALPLPLRLWDIQHMICGYQTWRFCYEKQLVNAITRGSSVAFLHPTARDCLLTVSCFDNKRTDQLVDAGNLSLLHIATVYKWAVLPNTEITENNPIAFKAKKHRH